MPVTPLPPGTASAGYFIEDEDRFTGSAAQFAGALFDVVVPDGTGGYVSRSVEESHLAELLGINRGANLRPDGFKSVRFLSRTDPRFDQASDHALDELDTTLGCLGTTCYVDFEKTRYVLVFDADPRPGGPSSGKQCWRDGHMAYPTPLVPCKWVPENAPEAVAVNVPEYDPAFNSDGTPAGYPAGFEVRYTLGGVEGHYVALVAGQLPAPTSPSFDANWRRVAPPTPATVIYQVMPYAAALNYDSEDQLTRGREYLITERGAGKPDVRGTFSSFAPAAMQYATLEGQDGAFTYDLASNTETATNGEAIPLAGTAAGAPVTGPVVLGAGSSLVFADQATPGVTITLDGTDGFQFVVRDGTGAVLGYYTLGFDSFALPAGAALQLTADQSSTPVSLSVTSTGQLLVNGQPVSQGNPTALTPTTGSVTLDFAATPRHTLTATGNVSFSTTGRSTAGADKTVYLKNTSSSSITLAYEAWTSFPAALPTTLAAGKELILTLTCLGTSVSDVKAAAVLSA